MTFAAPAKINLYLRVIRKMNDGYHQIETLFERISIFDYVSVDIADKHTVITCDDPQIPIEEDSLLGRTVGVFRDHLKEDIHFNVNVQKNIPVSAGLGGGSSDAATLLMALDAITGSGFEKEELAEMGRSLGSDVPFFIMNHSFAYGTGRGDIIREASYTDNLWHIIVGAPFGVSTKETYGKYDPFALTKDIGIDRMVSTFSEEKDIKEPMKNLHNDLQTIVLQDFPVLEKVFDELKMAGSKGTLLSGSGPTVFGVFDQSQVNDAADRLRRVFHVKDNWKIFVAHTC